MLRRFARPSFLLLICFSVASAAAQPRRMVIIDQDGSGPGGSNQMAMMVLLQSPQAEVLGITMVSGNAWEPEEVQHTLRMLELIHRPDVPVIPGAIFPLVRTEQESKIFQQLYGTFPWYGAWGDIANGTSLEPYHGPYVIPKLTEGEPTVKPSTGDAAHFLIRQVRAHPHQVTVYAAGPLTNIALAISIDPQFAELTQGIVIMGGSLSPQSTDPEFANNPRHEFNFWFDPEAAHITLRAHWPRIDLTTVDISIKTQFTKAMLDEIAQSPNPAAKYLAAYTSSTTSGMSSPPQRGSIPPSSPGNKNSTSTSISLADPSTEIRSPGLLRTNQHSMSNSSTSRRTLISHAFTNSSLNS